MVHPRARAPTCPLATLLLFFPEFRFAPPSPTVRTSLLLSHDVCPRCNLACDRLFTLVKFLHAPFWRPCTLAPGDICTPLPPPLRYASALSNIQLTSRFRKRFKNCLDDKALKLRIHFDIDYALTIPSRPGVPKLGCMYPKEYISAF